VLDGSEPAFLKLEYPFQKWKIVTLEAAKIV